MTHDNLQSKGGPMASGDGAKGKKIITSPAKPSAKIEPVSVLDRVNQILGGK